MTVFERIRDLAKKRGKSVRDVALNVGLSENAIYGWKKTKPKAEDLALVADELFTTVDYLLGREGAKQVNNPIDLAEVANSDDDDAIWETFLSAGGRPLTDKDKAVIKAVFSDRWEELQQKAKDLKDSEK